MKKNKNNFACYKFPKKKVIRREFPFILNNNYLWWSLSGIVSRGFVTDDLTYSDKGKLKFMKITKLSSVRSLWFLGHSFDNLVNFYLTRPFFHVLIHEILSSLPHYPDKIFKCD